MIAIAMLRGISYGTFGAFDQLWTLFWVKLEASVSVIMVSAMVFKTLFTFARSSTPEKHSPRSHGQSLKWRRTSQPPAVQTGPTMTGIRTVVREDERTKSGSLGEDLSPLTGSFDWASNGDSTISDSHV